MGTTKTIIGPSGSLRKGSYNTAILREAARLAPAGASPGGFGTVLSQAAWLPVLRTLGMKPWFGGRLLVSRAHKVVDADGRVADEATREAIKAFVEGFAAVL